MANELMFKEINKICECQATLSAEIAELRRQLTPLYTLPTQVALNKQAIDELAEEQRNAKKFIVKLVIGIGTAIGGGGLTALTQLLGG